MDKVIIGIDPGKTGGISSITNGKLTVCRMPQNVHDLISCFKAGRFMNMGENVEAFIEDVHAMPGMGVVSMFTFGKGLGEIRGVLATLRVPFTMVSSQKWQKHFSLPKKKEFGTTPKWKEHLRGIALQRWPGVEIHRDVADSVLIATYGWDQRKDNI